MEDAPEQRNQQRLLQLARVWPDEYTAQPRTGNVLVASLHSPKDIPTVMNLLKALLPLPELRHLKRVRRVASLPSSSPNEISTSVSEQPAVEIILTWATDDMKAGESLLSSDVLADRKYDCLLPFLHSTLRLHEVCVTGRLLTSEQWAFSHQHWPTVRPNPLISVNTDSLSQSSLSSDQLHRRFLDELKEGSAENSIDCLHNRVIIVDPARKTRVYPGLRATVTASSFNPLHHPVMLAIDCIASRQLNKPGEKRSVETLEETSTTDDASSYLCTGYFAYLLLEPCLMCSMALVHARIKCVIFCQENASGGALKSHFKLQGLKSLNHHFEVWQAGFSTAVSEEPP